MLWPERQEPLVTEVGGIVCTESVCFTADHRGTGGDENDGECYAAEAERYTAPTLQTWVSEI